MAIQPPKFTVCSLRPVSLLFCSTLEHQKKLQHQTLGFLSTWNITTEIILLGKNKVSGVIGIRWVLLKFIGFIFNKAFLEINSNTLVSEQYSDQLNDKIGIRGQFSICQLFRYLSPI